MLWGHGSDKTDWAPAGLPEGKTMKSKKARETCSYLRLPDPEHI